MTVGIGQVLKLLDMIPDKKGKRTFIEKLPSAQKLDGGNLSGLMAQMQAGGLSSLFKNPIGQLIGPAQDLIGAVMGAQGGAGANAFAAAVGGPGGLSDAVQRLASVTASLSGSAPAAAGLFGFADLALHESVLDQLGSSAPAAMALDVAAAPLNVSDLLSRASSILYQHNVDVIQNRISIDAATSDIVSFSAQINSILDASSSAILKGEAMAQDIAQVQTAAGMLVSGSDAMQTLIRQCLTPEAAAAMDAAMTERLTIRPPDDANSSPSSQN